MTDKVRFQYDDLQDVSRRFRVLNDRAEQFVRRANLCIQRMDEGAWIGEGADEYREEMEDIILPALRRLAGVLGDTAWTLDKSAEMMRDAEEMGARLFEGNGTPIRVNFEAVGIGGGSFGGGSSGWTSAEIERLADFFSGLSRGRGDDLGNINNIPDDSLDLRFGRGWLRRVQDLLDQDFPAPNPDIPPTLPGQNGPVVTPPWFTQHDTSDGGLNGAADAPVLVAGAGDHNRLTGDIAKTSQALGGGQVSGTFATESDTLRGPGGVAVPNPAVTSSHPAVLAMVEWLRAHPDGLFVMPPFSAAYGAEALNVLAAEGFDFSNLNVVTFEGSTPDLPDGLNHREVASFPDISVRV